MSFGSTKHIGKKKTRNSTFPKVKKIRISFPLSMINDSFLAFLYIYFPSSWNSYSSKQTPFVWCNAMWHGNYKKAKRIKSRRRSGTNFIAWWGAIVSIDGTCKKPYLSRHFASSFNMENEITIKWAVKTCIFQTTQSLIRSLLAQLQYILYHMLFH